MKRKHLLLVGLLLATITSCDKKPVDCMPPPPDIAFRLMDAGTNADLLANGTIKEAQLIAKDETGKSLDIFVTGDDTLKITRVVVGGNTGKHDYQLSAGEKKIDFVMDVYRAKCGFATRSKEVTTTHTTDPRGFYVVKF